MTTIQWFYIHACVRTHVGVGVFRGPQLSTSVEDSPTALGNPPTTACANAVVIVFVSCCPKHSMYKDTYFSDIGLQPCGLLVSWLQTVIIRECKFFHFASKFEPLAITTQ